MMIGKKNSVLSRDKEDQQNVYSVCVCVCGLSKPPSEY